MSTVKMKAKLEAAKIRWREARAEAERMDEEAKIHVAEFNARYGGESEYKERLKAYGIKTLALARYLNLSTPYVYNLLNGWARMPRWVDDELFEILTRLDSGLSPVQEDEEDKRDAA